MIKSVSSLLLLASAAQAQLLFPFSDALEDSQNFLLSDSGEFLFVNNTRLYKRNHRNNWRLKNEFGLLQKAVFSDETLVTMDVNKLVSFYDLSEISITQPDPVYMTSVQVSDECADLHVSGKFMVLACGKQVHGYIRFTDGSWNPFVELKHAFHVASASVSDLRRGMSYFQMSVSFTGGSTLVYDYDLRSQDPSDPTAALVVLDAGRIGKVLSTARTTEHPTILVQHDTFIRVERYTGSWEIMLEIEGETAALSPNGIRLAVCGGDQVEVYERSGASYRLTTVGEAESCQAIQINAAGSIVVAGGQTLEGGAVISTFLDYSPFCGLPPLRQNDNVFVARQYCGMVDEELVDDEGDCDEKSYYIVGKRYECQWNDPYASSEPSDTPSLMPSMEPSQEPSSAPIEEPTMAPTESPSMSPTMTMMPTQSPVADPTHAPSESPTQVPTASPTELPTIPPPAQACRCDKTGMCLDDEPMSPDDDALYICCSSDTRRVDLVSLFLNQGFYRQVVFNEAERYAENIADVSCDGGLCIAKIPMAQLEPLGDESEDRIVKVTGSINVGSSLRRRLEKERIDLEFEFDLVAGDWTVDRSFGISGENGKTNTVELVIGLTLAFIALIGCCVWAFVRKKRDQKNLQDENSEQ